MRILIVEDEALIAMDLEFLVEAMGHLVCGVAARAEEAIRLAADQSPDLILMDVQLAGGDSGIEAARVIAESLGIPILLVTANVAGIPREALPFTPLGMIVKPYSEEEIRRAISAVAWRREA